MNANYVSIKVDREERPDVDAIYMAAVQALTGSGGWPMSVWLTPDREPFFGGTYFPPRDGARGARHGFLTILREVKNSYDSDAERVRAGDRGAGGRRAREHGSRARRRRAARARTLSLIGDTVDAYKRLFDDRDGGLRRAPKFPSNVPVRLLLRYHARTRRPGGAADGDADAREDGGRRHVRSAGRRLPPLLDRRALAGAALREDAVRQRAARGRLRGSAPGHRARRLRARRARDARLPAARDDRARRRLLFGDRRRFEAARRQVRGGAVLRLVRGRDPRAAGRGRRRPTASSRTTASRRRGTSRARTSWPSRGPTRRRTRRWRRSGRRCTRRARADRRRSATRRSWRRGTAWRCRRSRSPDACSASRATSTRRRAPRRSCSNACARVAAWRAATRTAATASPASWTTTPSCAPA